MALINREIRYYQPNDPYYWQVDNLPLTDLLNNDVTLENRINGLEHSLNGLGNDASGSFGLKAIADLKAYVEPVSGLAGNHGKVYVCPGKFTARMQLPATRESGWRMMRDESSVFNNEEFSAANTNMLNTTTLTPFVRETQGVARTAVVEFYSLGDGSHKSIAIDSFDSADFNGASAPTERLDLVFIKGSKSLDTNGDSSNTPTPYLQDALPAASLGVVKGAYFRTDAAGGERTNGPRFTAATSRLDGRTTGLGANQIPANTVLPNFGTVPMPDDLLNFAWHRVGTESVQTLAQTQVTTQAAFCLPVAYIRVPMGYVEGDAINPENIVDIRPFLRTTELSYSERAAIAASTDPNGLNPFVTMNALQTELGVLEGRVYNNEQGVAANTGNIQLNTSRITPLETTLARVQADVVGQGTVVTAASLNHEGRIAAVESSVLGGPQIQVERHKFPSITHTVFADQVASQLGGNPFPGNQQWNITDAIPANDRAGLVAVQFRVMSVGVGVAGTNAPNLLSMKGASQPYRVISQTRGSQEGTNHGAQGMVNTFYAQVEKAFTGGTVPGVNVYVYTRCIGPDDVHHTLYIDGYIVLQGA